MLYYLTNRHFFLLHSEIKDLFIYFVNVIDPAALSSAPAGASVKK